MFVYQRQNPVGRPQDNNAGGKSSVCNRRASRQRIRKGRETLRFREEIAEFVTESPYLWRRNSVKLEADPVTMNELMGPPGNPNRLSRRIS